MAEDYESMTVSELKEILRERELKLSGKKSELIERLLEFDGVDVSAEDASESDEEVESSESDDDFDDFDDDDWDDEEEDEEYVAKQKPVLDEAMKEALALRAEQKKKTPSFRRQEWYRYQRLSKSGWRKPSGMDSKLRRNYKYRGSLVSVGHGKVTEARGLHPSGFREVMVHNPLDLEKINPATEAARVGATVGGRKREMIHNRADELGIRILNRRRDV
jgi:large subunit ribosomal protein L32e